MSPKLIRMSSNGFLQAYDTEGNQITYALTGPQYVCHSMYFPNIFPFFVVFSSLLHRGITISPATGVITLTSSVQSLGLRQYTVQATDNGQPQMSSSVPVTVIVNGDCVSAVSPVTAYSVRNILFTAVFSFADWRLDFQICSLCSSGSKIYFYQRRQNFQKAVSWKVSKRATASLT